MAVVFAGGNDPRPGADPIAGVRPGGRFSGGVSSPKMRAYSIITSDTKRSRNGITIGAPAPIAALKTKKIGNSTPPKNINFPARRIPLRRGDNAVGCCSSKRCRGSRPPASHSANPLSASPHREQNLISSEICC
jgi:hypothetical protein